MTFGVAQRAAVVDASVAIEILSGNAMWADRVAALIADNVMLLSPANFRHEVGNALLRGVRVDVAEALVAMSRLERLGIGSTSSRPLDLISTVGLADQHGLTVYDAAYLDLAIAVDGELLTLDRALRQAAIAEGVSVGAE